VNASDASNPLLVTCHGAILVLTLNRPDARNAVDRQTACQLVDSYAVLDADETLRAGVVTGAGGWFSSGMDLKAFANGERLDDAFLRSPPRKPLVAAIEGLALGGGLELALTCDLIVAARGARLGLPEVTRGLAASGGGLLRLSERIPYHLAMELALTGRPMQAARAAELGLVNRLVEPGAALNAALELAGIVATNAPLAVDVSKRIVEGSRIPARWEEQRDLAETAIASADALEGARAFAEGRPPRWSGR
jgi:enoyl-CoA hydratase